jgi:Ni/Fe-hydrogenase subunit HybB-like protein
MLHLQKQLIMEVDDTFSWNIIIKQNLIITSIFDITTIMMTTSLNEMFLMSIVLSRLSSLILRCAWKTKLDHDQKDMFVVYCLLTIIISNGNHTNMKQYFY